jgi:ribosomal protein S18 acetylase RimI-like enzyme
MAESATPLAVSVRPAAVADIDDLIPLYRGFMLHEQDEPPPEPELRRRLERLLASASDDVLIAHAEDGTPLGYLQQRYFLSVWRPDHDAFIEDVFVVEAARGRRVGERLLDLAFARARERGVRRICLDTNENNHRGRALYERTGFHNRMPQWDNGREIFYSKYL